MRSLREVSGFCVENIGCVLRGKKVSRKAAKNAEEENKKKKSIALSGTYGSVNIGAATLQTRRRVSDHVQR
jgi:hypothetical protein